MKTKIRENTSGDHSSCNSGCTFCVSPAGRCMDILDMVASGTVYGNGGNAADRKII